MDGFYTQRDFYRVYERIKRTLDEKVMVVRSWHSRVLEFFSRSESANCAETRELDLFMLFSFKNLCLKIYEI